MDKLHFNENLEKKILFFLIDHEGKWIKTEKIAKQLNLGFTHTRKIILNLKEDLKQTKDFIEIHTSKNKGIILIKKSDVDMQLIISNIYTSSIIYKLMKDLLYEKIGNLAVYSMNNFISISSLRRKISFINENLNSRGICIKKSRIFGDEFLIRSFLHQYFWIIFKDSLWSFDTVNKDTIITFVDSLENAFGYRLTNIQRERYYCFFAISKIRADKNKYLTNPIKECYLLCKGNHLYTEFKENYFQVFNRERCCEYELQYLFYAFSCAHIDFNSVSHNNLKKLSSIVSRQKNEANKISQELYDELDHMGFLHNKNIDTVALRMDLVAVCHTAVIFFKEELFPESYPFTKNLYQKYPMLHGQVLDILKKITMDKNILFNLNIIVEYISMLLHDNDDIRKYREKIYVSIILEKGVLSENILRIALQRHFSQSYNLIFNNNDKYDLLITDIGSLCLKNSKSFFLSHTRLNFKDLLAIEKRIVALTRQKSLIFV
ncbi:M protein trans-acting positive regulator [Enterococcus faecalis 13-SD-W-01]|nr:M protein trans-acting positive regulator [Enterococcus faecalis 13-SD-W-01]